MLLSTKLGLGAVAAAGAGGAYIGTSHAPEGAESDEKLARGTFAAGVGVTAAAGAIGAYKTGVFKAGMKSGAIATGSFLRTKAGMLVGGGAAIGAGVGAYMSDDPGSGAVKGAAVGAAAGGAVRVAQSAMKAHTALNATRNGRIGMKLGAGGIATLGALALAAGAHSLVSGNAPISTYSGMDDAGQTYYSDSPLKRRQEAMNAHGDLVFGLHNKR